MYKVTKIPILHKIDFMGGYSIRRDKKYSRTFIILFQPGWTACGGDPTTIIKSLIPKAEHLTLQGYDELDKEVSTLENEKKEVRRFSGMQ